MHNDAVEVRHVVAGMNGGNRHTRRCQREEPRGGTVPAGLFDVGLDSAQIALIVDLEIVTEDARSCASRWCGIELRSVTRCSARFSATVAAPAPVVVLRAVLN